jgi:hypothetical protein
VPQFQQAGPAAPQLPGQRRRRLTLGHATQQHDQLRRPPVRAGQHRPGENVERPAALATVIKDRRAIAAVDFESVIDRRTAIRTGQTGGMQCRFQPGVTRVLIHQIRNREIHSHDRTSM